MSWNRVFEVSGRKAYYLFQKVTGYGVDRTFELDLMRRGDGYLENDTIDRLHPREMISLNDVDFDDDDRFSVFRDDIYKRFQTDENAAESDHFGRRGKWIRRGCKIYFDRSKNEYVKVFDEHFCRRGEGRFLETALSRGLYDFLCPNLSYILVDDSGAIRGYSIREGRPITPCEFERYVGRGLRRVICNLTERTGLYFYDLEYHNIVRNGSRLSFIDLESILPLEWFGKGEEFSLNHLHDIDIGWSIQDKWRSPRWYRDFLLELTA